MTEQFTKTTAECPSPDPRLHPLPPNNDQLIRRSELPLYLPITVQTAARWAVEGQGPTFVKIGKRLVAYRVGDIKDWLDRQVRHNTISI